MSVVSRPFGGEPKIHPDYFFDEKTSTKLYARNGSNFKVSVLLLNFSRDTLKQQYDEYKKMLENKITKNEYILRSKFRENNRKLAPEIITDEDIIDLD